MTNNIADSVKAYGPIAFTVVLGVALNAGVIYGLVALAGAIGIMPTVIVFLIAGMLLSSAAQYIATQVMDLPGSVAMHGIKL